MRELRYYLQMYRKQNSQPNMIFGFPLKRIVKPEKLLSWKKINHKIDYIYG